MENTPKRKILLIEQHEPLRDTLIELLGLEGCEIVHATNGFSAIQLATDVLPDLIICSSRFSGLDCWSILQILKKETTTREIPFICLSDNPLGDEDSILKNELTILNKPFSNDELIHIIQSKFPPRNYAS